MRATTVLLELYLAYLRLHWAGAKQLVLESSHGVRENEPPKEAGLLVPPGALYIGCPGDKESPTIHYTCTVAEMTTGVLSHCGLHQHGTVLGTVRCITGMG
jgi:hypothetical protein